jgi:hypothetical protein
MSHHPLTTPKLRWIAPAAMIVLAAWWFSQLAATAVPYPYPLNYADGVTATWTASAIDGAGLYPAQTEALPYLHNPYGPIFYWMASGLSHGASLFSINLNPFTAARLLAMLSMLAACALLAITAHRLTRRHMAWLLPLLLIASPTVAHYAVTARVDSLALAFTAGTLLALCVKQGRLSTRRVAIAAALAALAFLTKPTYIAAPLLVAITAINSREKRSMPQALLPVLLPPAVIVIVAAVAIGPELPSFLVHLTRLNQLDWSIQRMTTKCLQAVAAHPILIAAWVYLMLHSARNHSTIRIYGWLALIPVLMSGKTGADDNYFLEAIACGAIALPLLVRDSDNLKQPTVAVLAMFQLLLFTPIQKQAVFSRTYDQELTAASDTCRPGAAEREMSALLVQELAGYDTPLSQSPGYLLCAGKRMLYQPYQYTQLERLGCWDSGNLMRAVESGKFDVALIQMDPKDSAKDYFPPEILKHIIGTWAPGRRIGPYQFFVK